MLFLPRRMCRAGGKAAPFSFFFLADCIIASVDIHNFLFLGNFCILSCEITFSCCKNHWLQININKKLFNFNFNKTFYSKDGNFSDNIVNDERFRKCITGLDELGENNVHQRQVGYRQKAGTYNHVINSILKGHQHHGRQLTSLFETYGINANFVISASEDDMFLEGTGWKGDPSHPQRKTARRAGKHHARPERAMAGYALEHQDRQFLDNLRNSPSRAGRGLVAFEINGDSMLPTITNGDVVV